MIVRGRAVPRPLVSDEVCNFRFDDVVADGPCTWQGSQVRTCTTHQLNQACANLARSSCVILEVVFMAVDAKPQMRD